MSEPKRSSIANILYSVVDTVTIADVSFNIYGSVLKTLEAVRKHSYAELFDAYVAITGDKRVGYSSIDMVAEQDVETVVCSEVQLRWAKITGRESLLESLQRNHTVRIEIAKSRSREHFLSKSKRERKHKPGAKHMQDDTTQDTGTVDDGSTGTPDKADDSTPAPVAKKKKKFGRGMLAFISQKLDEGVLEIETLIELCVASFPDTKNHRRHILYVARDRGFKLTHRL